MAAFKDFLKENPAERAPWHPTNVAEVRKIVDGFIKEGILFGLGESPRFSVSPDCSVNLDSGTTLFISDHVLDSEGRISLQFNNAGGVYVNATNLTDLRGLPKIIDSGNPDTVSIAFQCPNKIQNLEGFPADITGKVQFNWLTNDNFTLSGFNKICHRLSGKISLPIFYSGPLLSVLLINGFRGIVQTIPIRKHNPDLDRASGIINQHLMSHHPDILECQEELRTAGLRRFGKL